MRLTYSGSTFRNFSKWTLVADSHWYRTPSTGQAPFKGMRREITMARAGTLVGTGFQWKLPNRGAIALVAEYGGTGVIDVNVRQDSFGQSSARTCTLISGGSCSMYFPPVDPGIDHLQDPWSRTMTSVSVGNGWCDECGWLSTTDYALHVFTIEERWVQY
jgi:hypothetical protein